MIIPKIFTFEPKTTFDAVKEALTDMDNSLDSIVKILTVDPSVSSEYATMWGMVQNLIIVSTTVATVLVVLYWLTSFIEDIQSMDWRHLDIWFIFRKIIQLILAKTLIDVAPDLLLSLLRFSSWAVTQFMGGGNGKMFESITFDLAVESIKDMGFIDQLLLRVELIIPKLVIKFCEIAMYIIAYSRILQICLLTIISPISLSTVANGRRSGAWSFIKQYVSVIGQSVVIVISIQLYRGMVGLMIAGDITGVGTVYKILVSTITLVSCIIGAQKVARHFLG